MAGRRCVNLLAAGRSGEDCLLPALYVPSTAHLILAHVLAMLNVLFSRSSAPARLGSYLDHYRLDVEHICPVRPEHIAIVLC